MKKIASLTLAIGILAIVVSLLGDVIGLGKRGSIGAAQILGFDIGVSIILFSVGLLVLNRDGDMEIRKRLQTILTQISNASPIVWIVTSFVTVYLFLFIAPMFFSKLSIQYFTKYIPDAYVTHIGFDVDMTM